MVGHLIGRGLGQWGVQGSYRVINPWMVIVRDGLGLGLGLWLAMASDFISLLFFIRDASAAHDAVPTGTVRIISKVTRL